MLFLFPVPFNRHLLISPSSNVFSAGTVDRRLDVSAKAPTRALLLGLFIIVWLHSVEWLAVNG